MAIARRRRELRLSSVAPDARPGVNIGAAVTIVTPLAVSMRFWRLCVHASISTASPFVSISMLKVQSHQILPFEILLVGITPPPPKGRPVYRTC